MQSNQDPPSPKKKKRERPISSSSVTVPFRRGCEAYGLSYKTARAAAFRGELAIIKIGRNWYIRRSEVERFLDAHTERFTGK